MNEQVTKQMISQAAVSLFNTKGFSGTSVREISKKANVNVSLISYYFNGKQGLLEHLMESFFEAYVRILENAYELSETLSARKSIQNMMLDLLYFQQENSRLARFVHRETTIDSTLTREIMAIYLRREKFYWQKVFEKGFHTGEFKKSDLDLTIIQLKGMLTMPFSNPQYVEEIFHLSPSEPYFIKKYSMYVIRWLDERFLINREQERKVEVG